MSVKIIATWQPRRLFYYLYFQAFMKLHLLVVVDLIFINVILKTLGHIIIISYVSAIYALGHFRGNHLETIRHYKSSGSLKAPFPILKRQFHGLHL